MNGLEDGSAHLELELGATDVALHHLVSAGGTFAGLIHEVARSYLGTRKDPLRWIVTVEKGSVRLPLRPEVAHDEVAPSAIPGLIEAITNGLALLDMRAERPVHFSDKALQDAKALSNLVSDELPITVRNGKESAELSKRVAANVDDLLGPPETSYGTVEGALEGIQIHGAKNQFAVYDALTGVRTECRLSEDVTLDDLRPAIGKQVGIRGEITRRASGDRIIVAHALSIFPSEDDLPSVEDVLGILEGYEREA